MRRDIISEKQDMTYLSWTKLRGSSGTAGSFLKAYYELGGKKVYCKLSDYDAYEGITGHECVNELIVDRLLCVLGVEHLSYTLVHADVEIYGKRHETWLCASEDFKKPGESKMALDAYYQAERREEELPLAFCVRQGWEDYIYQMLAVDFLILNRDRHGANMEVLRNSKERTVRLAPLFDHGLSLLCRCHDSSEIEKFDVMGDLPVQCFVGSRSAGRNLELIPKDRMPDLKPLKETDKDSLLEGLDAVLPAAHLDKIWKMIWERWKAYEDFCHQR